MRVYALLLLLGPLGCTFGAEGGGGSASVPDGTTDGLTTGADASTMDAMGDGDTPGSADASGTSPAETSMGPAGTSDASDGGDATAGSVDASTDEGTTASTPACTSALLVTGDPDPTTSGDAPFHERLLELGYEVTVVGNAESQASDADGHCLVLLSALGAATDVEDKFRDVAVPVVTWEYNLYDNMRMVDGGDPANWGIADPLDDIDIVDPTHPMAAGTSGIVAIFSGGGRIAWGVPEGDAQIVATLPGAPQRAALFGFAQGAAMASGFVAPAARVGYPHGQTPVMTTAQAVDLFEAAVQWAVQ